MYVHLVLPKFFASCKPSSVYDDIIFKFCSYDVMLLRVTASAATRTQPSIYKLNFGISRISLFYVVNFFLITFLVVIATISCTIIHFTDFGSRSSITFTILLTLISFKFIMANYTPTINYMVRIRVHTKVIPLLYLNNIIT